MIFLLATLPVRTSQADPPVAAQNHPYFDTLWQTAKRQRLWQRREWHKLIHYLPNLVLPGVHSLADSANFFLAKDGNIHPAAELRATLAAFFADTVETDKQQHPQCAFIARYHWLKQILHFDPVRLPEQNCRRYRQWLKSLNPAGLTLIFPAGYLNNPASMYGHTLLRVDARDQDDTTRLLAYAMNYAADTDETSGLVFAVKGLTGGYTGKFSIAPYYLKVREYNDLENRDIWEYQLNFTQAETERALEHLWELGQVRFDYFFFDENCSYHLLSLFEVARSSLHLTDSFRWWAIPVDTVRRVTEQQGLLKRAVFRPAAATTLKYHIDTASTEQRHLTQAIAAQRITLEDRQFTALPAGQQAAVLDVSHDYLDYRQITGKLGKDQAAPLQEKLLLARSRLAPEISGKPVPTPMIRPDEGHRTARLTLGGGFRDGLSFGELRLRPAYHDLLDPDPGYQPGAQIDFFHVAIRGFKNGDVRLEEFRPVNIVSLTPRDDFFTPLSWKVNAGVLRQRLTSTYEPLVFRLQGAPGLAWEFSLPLASKALVYGFFNLTADVAPALQDNFAIGGGPEVGFLIDITPSWRILLRSQAQRYLLGDAHTSWEATLEQRFTLNKNNVIRLDVARHGDFGDLWNEARLAWQYYF